MSAYNVASKNNYLDTSIVLTEFHKYCIRKLWEGIRINEDYIVWSRDILGPLWRFILMESVFRFVLEGFLSSIYTRWKMQERNII